MECLTLECVLAVHAAEDFQGTEAPSGLRHAILRVDGIRETSLEFDLTEEPAEIAAGAVIAASREDRPTGARDSRAAEIEVLVEELSADPHGRGRLRVRGRACAGARPPLRFLWRSENSLGGRLGTSR